MQCRMSRKLGLYSGRLRRYLLKLVLLLLLMRSHSLLKLACTLHLHLL
jgi:hypothetical protein